MHATKIKQKVGNLGPHEKILEVGDDNHMLSQEGSDAPLWMNPQDRVSKKFSQYDEPQFKDKTKSELLGNLRIAGVDIYLEKEKRTVSMRRKERVKVYMGKPERLLQVLWEHVLMDTPKEVCTPQILRGWEDNYGNKILETILR